MKHRIADLPSPVKSTYRNAAFTRVPKTPLRGLAQAVESAEAELRGPDVPKSDEAVEKLTG